jgi:hypothetical protein
VDVLDPGKDGAVCVYDIKTGLRRFIPGRMAEIANTVLLRFPWAQRIIAVEMRPGHAVLGR